MFYSLEIKWQELQTSPALTGGNFNIAVAEANTLYSEVIKNAEKWRKVTEFIMILNQQRAMLDSNGDPRL